jgi:SAM-dependent methyltransferase
VGSETTKATARRLRDPRYSERFMVGEAIDIGSGPDPLTVSMFPKLTSVRTWDLRDGDAQYMRGVDATFDTVHSSHCLEHMIDPVQAVAAWWSLVRPGGHLVLIVPDWEMYERYQWPSIFNGDHKCAFTVGLLAAPEGVPLFDLRRLLAATCEDGAVVLCDRIHDGFDPMLSRDKDQSTLGAAVCIDAVVYKPRQQGC